MKTKFLQLTTLCLLCVISVAFTSCNKNKVENNKLASITIQNAKALFISSSNNEAKLYGIQSSALKSSDEDEIFEIKYLNSAGEEIIKSNPREIYNLKDFVVLVFETYETYLVNKSSGKVYELLSQEYVLDYECSRFLGMKPFQESENNNLYFVRYKSGEAKLFKLSLSNLSSLQFEQVSAVNDHIYHFCVDKVGDIFYAAYNGTSDNIDRYRKADGSFVIPNFGYILKIWVGTDGQMYAIQGQGKIVNDKLVVMLSTIQDGVFTPIKEVHFRGFENKIFYVQGKMICAHDGMLFNIANENDYSETPCALTPTHAINNELYNFDKETFKLTKIDVSTGTTSLVSNFDKTKLGNYDIGNIINVSVSGITFSATDLRNGNYVVAKISTDNSVVIQTTITGTIGTVVSLN
ncbi:MAG: hypothetical protein FWC39_13930 [Bacteroidetes bacterium]|nr:hypothetical protein [Bacteroidota bacterium]